MSRNHIFYLLVLTRWFIVNKYLQAYRLTFVPITVGGWIENQDDVLVSFGYITSHLRIPVACSSKHLSLSHKSMCSLWSGWWRLGLAGSVRMDPRLLAGLKFFLHVSLSLSLFFLALWRVGFSFPDQGSNPCLLQWRDGVLTTGLLGKSLFKSSFWGTVWRNRGSSLISIPKMCSSSMKIPWLEVTWLSWYQRSREVPPPTVGSIAMFPIIRMSRAGHKNQAITDGGHCPWNWKRPRKMTYSSPLLLVLNLHSKCCPRTSRITITWKLVRNAESQAPPHTC